MSLPGWQLFRVIDLTSPTDDPDWAGEPETYEGEAVADEVMFPVALDIGNGRGPVTKIAIYAVLLDSSGDLVDRGSMTYSLTPLELVRPGPRGVAGVGGAEPVAVIDGTTEDSAPYQKATLEIGPIAARIGVAVRDYVSVPGTAASMRMYWRPAP